MLRIGVTQIIVVEAKGNGHDHVVIKTDVPCPYKTDGNLMMHFTTKIGKAVEYVRSQFGIEPKII